MMPPPRTPSSLHDLLAQERVDDEDDDNALQLASCRATGRLPQRPHGASSRARSCRHASPQPPPLATNTTAREAEGEAAGAGAVVAVLSAYAGRLLRDTDFRRALRDKGTACLAPAAASDDDDAAGRPVLANLELGIESIERLAANNGSASVQAQAPRDTKIRSLRNSTTSLPRKNDGGLRFSRAWPKVL